jgi:hypothetical protein
VEVEERIPLKRALGVVFISVVIIWGLIFFTWLIHQKLLGARQRDPHYKVVAIAQTTSERAKLACWQLAEMLNLSHNAPQNLYSFDPRAAEKRLLSYPIFKRATCHRLRPGIVHVDYLLREPAMRLTDLDNVAIDREGNLFPLAPYYTPKCLPELCVGIDSFSGWNRLSSREAALALKIMEHIECSFPASIKTLRIDTHAAFHPSAGSREVVVVLEDGVRRFLRLKRDGFEETLRHYLALRDTFGPLQKEAKEQVIDLRCPNIALVS